MSTEVNTTATTALAALKNLKGAIQGTQQIAPRGSSDPYLKMDNHGVWMYGAENVEVEKGSEWALNPFSAQHGWVCWKAKPQGSKEKSEKLGEVAGPLGDLQPKNTLPDYGMNGQLKNEWQYFVSLSAKCLTGEDAGEQVVYNPSSMGGVDALLGRDRRSGLLGAIGDQIDVDPTKPVPVVVLENDSYNNKTHGGRTFVPVLRIVRWIGLDGLGEADAPAAAEQPKAVEQAAAPEPQQEAPAAQPETAAAPAGDGTTRRRRRPVA